MAGTNGVLRILAPLVICYCEAAALLPQEHLQGDFEGGACCRKTLTSNNEGGENMLEYSRKNDIEYKLIFCKYIVRKGRRIYPKKAKCFRFWMKVKPNA